LSMMNLYLFLELDSFQQNIIPAANE